MTEEWLKKEARAKRSSHQRTFLKTSRRGGALHILLTNTIQWIKAYIRAVDS